jgi:hypothetical protein
VRKITIKGVDKEFAEAAANYVDKEQQPNNVAQPADLLPVQQKRQK